jgi:hypothetical protein
LVQDPVNNDGAMAGCAREDERAHAPVGVGHMGAELRVGSVVVLHAAAAGPARPGHELPSVQVPDAQNPSCMVSLRLHTVETIGAARTGRCRHVGPPWQPRPRCASSGHAVVQAPGRGGHA